MSDSNFSDGIKIGLGGIAGLVAVVALSLGLSYVFGVGGMEIDRQVVEHSRQYSATNTDLFYTKLESVKKIDVQLAQVGADSPMYAPLTSQKLFLESELRKEVAKIPVSSRTSDMFLYQ